MNKTMKTIYSVLFGVFSVFLVFTLTSCKNAQESTINEPQEEIQPELSFPRTVSYLNGEWCQFKSAGTGECITLTDGLISPYGSHISSSAYGAVYTDVFPEEECFLGAASPDTGSVGSAAFRYCPKKAVDNLADFYVSDDVERIYISQAPGAIPYFRKDNVSAENYVPEVMRSKWCTVDKKDCTGNYVSKINIANTVNAGFESDLNVLAFCNNFTEYNGKKDCLTSADRVMFYFVSAGEKYGCDDFVPTNQYEECVDFSSEVDLSKDRLYLLSDKHYGPTLRYSRPMYREGDNG